MKLALNDIDVDGRHRNDLGDINGLALSIKDIGLLQPIVVTPANRLIAGERRIAAARKLGWKDIDVRVIDNFDDAAKLLRAERDENTCRKDFSPSEAVALGRILETLERPLAKERQHQAGGDRKSPESKAKIASGNLPEAIPAVATPSVREIVGAQVGMSGTIYQRAKAVVSAAEAEPDKYGPIADEMDRTGKVTPAYFKIAKEPDEKRDPKVRGVGISLANEAINNLIRIPKNDALRSRGLQLVSDWIRHNK